MLASVTHILPITTITRKRVLPVDGQVLVKQGQKVSAGDTLAQTVINRKYVVIDVAGQLRTPAAQADAAIKVKRGQKVAKGDLLAEIGGLFARRITASATGRVVVVGSGKIVLESGGASLELRCGLSGTVTDVIPNRGAIIRATGALIQGVWGNGKSETGVMLNLLETPDDILTASRLDVSMRGGVLLGGHLADPATLKSAIELSLRGMVLGSMAPAALPAIEKAPFPVLLLEGFGNRPVNSVAFKLLTTNAKREVSLLADAERLHTARPELFIPLPVAQEPPEPRDEETFAPGQTVRVCFLSRSAQMGKILQLHPTPASLPNGVVTLAADVQLENGQQALVPLNNLEVLG